MKRLLCWILATVVAILLGAATPSAAAQIEIRGDSPAGAENLAG